MKRLFKAKATDPTPYPINQPYSQQPQASLPTPYPPPSSHPTNQAIPNGVSRQPIEYHPAQQYAASESPASIPAAAPPRRRDKLFKLDKDKAGVTPFPADIIQEVGIVPDEAAFGRVGKQKKSRDATGDLGRGTPPPPMGMHTFTGEQAQGAQELKRKVSLKSKGDALFGNWGRDRKEKQNEKEREKERTRQAGTLSPIPGQEYPRYGLQDQALPSPDLSTPPTFYQDPRGRSMGQNNVPYHDATSNPYLVRSPQPTPSPGSPLPNPFSAPKRDFYDNDRANSSAESYAQLAPATPPAHTKPPPNGMTNIRVHPPLANQADSGVWSPNGSDELHAQQSRPGQRAQFAQSPSLEPGYLSTSPRRGDPYLSQSPNGGPGWQGTLTPVMSYDSTGPRVDIRPEALLPVLPPRNIPFLQPRKAPVPPPNVAVSRSPNGLDSGSLELSRPLSPAFHSRLPPASDDNARPSLDVERSLGGIVASGPNKLQRLKSPMRTTADEEAGHKERKGFLGFGGGSKAKWKDGVEENNSYEEFDPSTGQAILPGKSKEALKGEKQRGKVLEKQLASNGTATDTVTSAITSLCGRASGFDLPEITTLLQRVDTSPEDVAKEAARAVRKEIKYGRTDAERVFAIKIWMLGCLNFSARSHFRVQTLDKRFLASIQQVLAEPPGGAGLSNDAYERLRDTLAHLNFSLGAGKGGETLREVWAKVKTPEEPTEGYPFPSTHPVFSPSDRLLRRPSQTSFGGHGQIGHEESDRGIRVAKDASVARLIPDEQQEMHRLIRECSAASEHAAVLNNALVYTTPQKLASEPVIKEFYAVCVRDQESLVSQMGWSNSKAELSRMERGIDTPAATKQSFDLASGGRQAPEIPLAERAFDELLKANEQITQVLRIHEELESLARAEQELDMVKEKSKAETRGDRGHKSSNYAGESAGVSMSSTPARVPSPQPHRPESRNQSHPRAAHAHGNSVDSQYGARLDPSHAAMQAKGSAGFPPLARSVTPENLDPPRRLEDDSRAGSPTRKVLGPRPLSDLRRNKHGSDSSLNGSIGTPRQAIGQRQLSGLAGDGSDVEENYLVAPSRPSQKALGKRRVVESQEEANTFDPDDMWKTNDRPSESSDSSSEDDLLDPSYVPKKPVRYVYDAAVDREVQWKNQRQSRRNGSSSQSMSMTRRREPGEGGSSGGDDFLGQGMAAGRVAEPDEVLAMPGGAIDGGGALLYAADALNRPVDLRHAPSGRWKPWKR